MKAVLCLLKGKIVKLYLRNEQNFSARIMSVEEDIVYCQSQWADVYIRIDDLVAVTHSLDTPLADAPTKNMYHPKNKHC